jgi:hypothetical protein
MLAARRSLGRANPDLMAWSERQWQAWLRNRQRSQAAQAGPGILIVAALSCIDDVGLHVGLMQLLSIASVRCTVVLSLPTEEMALLAEVQARREGWHMLARIVAQAECGDMLQRLSPADKVAVFPYPAVLSPERDLEAAASGAEKNSILASQRAFVGTAAQYAAWFEAHGVTSPDRFLEALKPMFSLNAAALPSVQGNPPLRAATAEKAPDQIVRLRSEGMVDVAGLSAKDELVITAPEEADAAVLVRVQAGAADQPMRIRLPAAMLTTTPRRIRLERRSAGGRVVGGGDLLLHVPPSHLKPWMMAAFLNRGGAGNPVIRAFAEGIGCRIAYAEDEGPVLQDVPVVWGVLRDSDRIIAHAKAQSLYFFYIDHAYFDRGHGKSYRITRNGYEAGPIRLCPNDRFGSLGVCIAPWRKGGREIIVCPPTEYFMQAHGCPDWLDTTLTALRGITDRPISVRQKPQPGEGVLPLQTALETAHALVAHSSNVAIEAACLGTPVFVAPTSAAAPVGRTDLSMIDTPAYPDREPWLAHLAYNQFALDEIRDGRAWRLLLELEERDLV